MVNVAPSLADITAAITGAVNAAVAPLNDRLARLEGQQAAGITPATLAGAPAASNVIPPAEEPQKPDFSSMSPAQLINLGRKNLMNKGQTVPIATAN